MTETKTLEQIGAMITDMRVEEYLGRMCERWVLEADVLRERMELKEKLEELMKIRPSLVCEDAKHLWKVNVHDPDDVSDQLYDLQEWFEKFEKVLAVLGKETNK